MVLAAAGTPPKAAAAQQTNAMMGNESAGRQPTSLRRSFAEYRTCRKAIFCMSRRSARSSNMSELRASLVTVLIVLSLSAFPLADSTNAAGQKFLNDNALKEDVVVLPSGLQYKVLVEGTGRETPFSNTSCLVHYTGSLIDGTEFDSSYKRGKVSLVGVVTILLGHFPYAAKCSGASIDDERVSRSACSHDRRFKMANVGDAV
jgi:FKBP-type peptidyl-prolyl cis-trans isomerase